MALPPTASSDFTARFLSSLRNHHHRPNQCGRQPLQTAFGPIVFDRKSTHGTGTTGIEVLIKNGISLPPKTIAVNSTSTPQNHPLVVVINRHIGRGIRLSLCSISVVGT